MATLPLKSSRNEQRAVIRFLWAKGLNANEIYSEMCPVYGDKCFTRPAIHVFVRSLLAAEKALLIRNDLAGMLLRRPMGIQKLVDRWDKCLNKLGRYVKKMKH